MNNSIKILVISLITIIVAFVAVFFSWVSYNNSEIEMRNLIEAQVETRNANYDKAWTTIKQQAQLTERYANDFKEVYRGMLEGRYGENGSQAVFQWIQEQNPQLDPSLYTTVQTTIEAQRQEFFNEQRKLISYDREHKVLRQQFPGNLFVGSRPDVEFNIIMAEQTQSTIETGVEKNIEVF